MTIADQLKKVARTKKAIARAIEDMGGDVTGADFADYPAEVVAMSMEEPFLFVDLSTKRADGSILRGPVLPFVPFASYMFDEAHSLDAVAIGNYNSPYVVVYTKDLSTPVASVRAVSDPFVSFSRDDAYLAAGSFVYATNNWTEVVELASTGVLRFSPTADILTIVDGTTLTVVDATDWSVATTVTLPMFNDSSRSDCTTAFSPDGSMFAVVGSFSPKVVVYDTTTWTQVDSISTTGADDVGYAVEFSPDGTILAVAYGPNAGSTTSPKLYVYDTSTWAHQAAGWTGNTRPTSVSFAPGGQLIVGTTADSPANSFFRYASMTTPSSYNARVGWMRSSALRFARDGSSAYAYGRWDVISGDIGGALIRVDVEASPPALLTSTPIRSASRTIHPRVAVARVIPYQRSGVWSLGGVHGLVDSATGVQLPLTCMNGRGVLPNIFGPNTPQLSSIDAAGRVVVCAGTAQLPAEPTRVAEVWVIDTQDDVLAVRGTSGNPTSVAISPDGSKVAVAVGLAIAVHERATWAELYTFTASSAPASHSTRMAVTNDGVLAYQDGTVIAIARPPSGAMTLTPALGGHSFPLAFSPSGDKLYCIGLLAPPSTDGYLRVLNVATNTWATETSHLLIDPVWGVMYRGTVVVMGGATYQISLDDFSRWRYVGAVGGTFVPIPPE